MKIFSDQTVQIKEPDLVNEIKKGTAVKSLLYYTTGKTGQALSEYRKFVKYKPDSYNSFLGTLRTFFKSFAKTSEDLNIRRILTNTQKIALQESTRE